MTLEQILNALGIAGDEARVYRLLLSTRELSAGAVSKRLGIPRASVYDHLRRLTSRGLVSESGREATRHFRASSPRQVGRLLSRRRETIDEASRCWEKLLPEIEAARPSSPREPKLVFHDGATGLRNVLLDMLNYPGAATFAFWPIRRAVDVLGGDFFAQHNRKRILAGIETRAIWPSDQVLPVREFPYLGSGPGYHREIRIAPPSVRWALGYWAYADRVAFLSSQHESFGFVVESRELVETMRVQFDAMWRLSKQLKTKPADAREFLSSLAA